MVFYCHCLPSNVFIRETSVNPNQGRSTNYIVKTPEYSQSYHKKKLFSEMVKTRNHKKR